MAGRLFYRPAQSRHHPGYSSLSPHWDVLCQTPAHRSPAQPHNRISLSLVSPDLYGASLLPPQIRQRRLHRYDRFRGSIARLLCSLFTSFARGPPLLTTMQNSLPTGGQPLLGGILNHTHRVSLKSFNYYLLTYIYIHASVSPLPGLILARLNLLTSFFSLVAAMLWGHKTNPVASFFFGHIEGPVCQGN